MFDALLKLRKWYFIIDSLARPYVSADTNLQLYICRGGRVVRRAVRRAHTATGLRDVD